MIIPATNPMPVANTREAHGFQPSFVTASAE